MTRLKIANSYGSVDVRGKLARTYVHVPGLRLQPLCRKLGIRYADALVGFSERGRKARFGYGPVLNGVVVSARSAPTLRLAVEERDRRSAERAEREKERAERRLALEAARRAEAERQRRLETEQRLSDLFPRLPEATRTTCVENRLTVFGPTDPLPSDQYTAREWRHLGAAVKPGANPSGFLARRRGAVSNPLFTPNSVEAIPSPRSGWEPVRLWQFWRGGFQCDLVALATAVRFANRLIKLTPFVGHKRPVYEVKDRFIRFASSYLRECRVSRIEEKSCWGCGGTGAQGDEECDRCDGGGVYSSRTLYEHLFEIDGDEFNFHSYVAPPSHKLSNAAGADLRSYGRRFTPAELPRVRLRVPEFVALIGYALEHLPSALPTTPDRVGAEGEP